MLQTINYQYVRQGQILVSFAEALFFGGILPIEVYIGTAQIEDRLLGQISSIDQCRCPMINVGASDVNAYLDKFYG